MPIVLAGTTGADPSTIWPEKYKNCFWNFVTGWQCETVDAPAAPPPVYSPPAPLGNTPDPNTQPAMLPVLANGAMTSGDCGCCGGASAPVMVGGAPAGAGPSATPVAAGGCGKCSGCGYSNREALFAVAVALVFFLLVND